MSDSMKFTQCDSCANVFLPEDVSIVGNRHLCKDCIIKEKSMKYKIGDIVKITTNKKVFRNSIYNIDKRRWAGKTMTVSGILGGFYEMKEEKHTAWTDEFISKKVGVSDKI